MKPQYLALSGTTPKIITLNTNNSSFQVSIDAPSSVLCEGALEDPADPTTGSPGPTWVALPAAVNGIISLSTPFRMLRFTPTTGGNVTVLQQGLDFLGTGPGGPQGFPTAPILSPALFNWRTGGTYGKKAIFLGDSTTSAPSPPWADITGKLGQYNTPGGQMDNVATVNAGEIGVTFANVMNGTSVFNINWLLAQTFDLLVVCLGINDVRDGSTNAAQISAMLTSLVSQVHTARPNACIVLWTPNSFLSNDPTSSNYITPNISFAQQYTDALWNGYNNVVGTWPTYVAHLDKQLVYGRTCKPGPTALMQDTLHPDTVTGYQPSLPPLAGLIQPRGWPYTPTSNDPFLVETVLGLNGDALTDYRGRHTISSTPAGIVASGGWLVFNGTGALQVLSNLADFQFGTWSGGSGDAKVTVELQIISPVRVQPNGQVWWCNNNNLQIGNNADPNYFMNVGNFGSTELGNASVVTGTKVDYAFEFGQNIYSTYKNGVRLAKQFANVDFNTGAGTLFLGQEQTGWAAVIAQGQLRVRVTRECRFNHAPNYTPYPATWPIT